MKNRYFQFLRGILIICVILIHTIYGNSRLVNYFNITLRSIINCCVAIFIFISAYFVNKSEVDEKASKYIGKRSLRLIIPLLIWNIIYGIIDYINCRDINSTLIKFKEINTASHLYYVCVLFQLVILTPIIIKLMKNKIAKIILYLITPIYLIILLICEVFLKKHIEFYQYFSCGWIIYYLLGVDKDKLTKNSICVAVIMLLISILGNNFVYYINESNYSYASSQLNILNMMYVISLIPVLLKYNSKYETTKINKFFENIGDNSYGIYFIHIVFLNQITPIIKQLNMNFVIYYIVTTVITLIISYCFIRVFKIVTRGKLDKYLGF